MELKSALPCFKCGKALENVFAGCVRPAGVETPANQPYAGTEFRTLGHYGSTFWDSFEGEELILNVCDPCLSAHIDRLAVQKTSRSAITPLSE